MRTSHEVLLDTTDLLLSAESLGKQVTSPDGVLTILDDINFNVQRGETVAIVGPSGAGKSTLLALLAGLDEPTSGRVLLDGIDLTALDEDGRAGMRNEAVGFIFQSFHLLPSLTAIENVMLPLELGHKMDARKTARTALAEVGLSERTRHYPHQLSGGEQQRVAIARAFVTQPALLFADEPTGNLDQETGAQVLDLLFKLNSAADTTLVVVTHDPEAARRCTHIMELRAGRLTQGSQDPTSTSTTPATTSTDSTNGKQ